MIERHTGYIKSFGNLGFIAGINGLPGMVEQANSPQGAIEKLLLGLRIRSAYIHGIDLSKVSGTIEPATEIEPFESEIPEKRVDLVLQQV